MTEIKTLNGYALADTEARANITTLSEEIAGLTAADVGADAAGTAASQINTHNSNASAHPAIQELITTLTNRLNALADSDDTTLDQLSEIVAYIKSNKSLIDSITTGKVSVSDIVDNLISTATNKPLSANQGRVLSETVTTLTSTKVSLPTTDSAPNYGTAGQFAVSDGTGGIAWKTLYEAEGVEY